MTVLDELPRGDFDAVVGELFEGSWDAAPLWRARPFESAGGFCWAAAHLLLGSSDDVKARVINAHPRLSFGGEPTGGTAWSKDERAGISRGSLDQLTSDSAARRLADLNVAYEHRHGFRFVMRARRRALPEIVGNIERRLGRSRAQELRVATVHVAAIAASRVRQLD